MKLTSGDIARLVALLIGTASLVTGPVLEAFGLSQNAATHALAILGFVVNFLALASKIFSTPSPPAGSSYAAIPAGSIPVVGNAIAGTGPSVAQVDPSTTVVRTIAPSPNAIPPVSPPQKGP
jgi:hypothetical protein